MIDSGKRVVTFLDTGADFTSVPYLIAGMLSLCLASLYTYYFVEFGSIWETAFDVTDTTFDCNVNRSSGDTSTQMYLINHFLDKVVLGSPAPDVDHANTTNSASGVGSLGEQALNTCVAANGKYPSFMLVDVSD
jgi:hypothetical protein